MTDLVEGAYSVRSTLGGSPFPPIADYGFLSDCEVSALVAPSGNVEWMCLPRMGPWRHGSARSETHQRAPVDHSAERVLLRTARCLQGTVDFVLECEPAFDYGRQRGTWRYTGDGYGEAEALAGSEPQFRLTTDLNVGFEGPRAIARRRLRVGDKAFCALSWQDGTPPENFAEAHQRVTRTAHFWHEWLGGGKFPDRGGRPRPGAVRKAALLREPVAAVRRGDRPAFRASPRELPAGLLPPGAHQRGHPPDPRRRNGPVRFPGSDPRWRRT